MNGFALQAIDIMQRGERILSKNKLANLEDTLHSSKLATTDQPTNRVGTNSCLYCVCIVYGLHLAKEKERIFYILLLFKLERQNAKKRDLSGFALRCKYSAVYRICCKHVKKFLC